MLVLNKFTASFRWAYTFPTPDLLFGGSLNWKLNHTPKICGISDSHISSDTDHIAIIPPTTPPTRKENSMLDLTSPNFWSYLPFLSTPSNDSYKSASLFPLKNASIMPTNIAPSANIRYELPIAKNSTDIKLKTAPIIKHFLLPKVSENTPVGTSINASDT